MRFHVVVAFALLVAATPCLSGCKIKYDSDKSEPTAGGGAVFNAKAYVDSIWDGKVTPLAHAPLVDVATLIAAVAKDPDAAGKQYGHRAGDGQPWTYLLRGEGKVAAVDVQSRHGTATVELTVDGKTTSVILQIGPVIFGTALRDSLPFIAFGDFVNQIDYAEVSRALNDRATAGDAAAIATATGRSISFSGAAVAPSGSTPLTVTPIQLNLGNLAP